MRGEAFDGNETQIHGIRRHTPDGEADAENCAWCGEVRLHVWDFGGQDIMHATHQFFLTRRSVYLLVLNIRISEEQNRLEYWLRMIQNFGGGSPVIVACNQSDEQGMDLDWDGLRKKYPQVVSFVRRVSCLKGEGIEDLRTEIGRIVGSPQAMPLVHQPFRAAGRRVKDRLEAEITQEISRTRYETICDEGQVGEGSPRETLLGVLHALGSILHFGSDHERSMVREKHAGQETFVRNPGWVTSAVYKILNETSVKEQKGVLAMAQLPGLLAEVENNYHYTGREKFFIDLMEDFDLCFRFEGDEERVWIPDLSTKQAISAGDWAKEVVFRYEYDVLPTSVMTRFLVKMHPMLLGRDSFWRKGAILERNGIRALVTADEADGFVEIWMDRSEEAWSDARREFFGLIGTALEDIHESFQDRLGLEEKVPVPEREGVFRDLEELVEAKREGETEVFVKGSGRVSIASMLPFLTTLETPVFQTKPGGGKTELPDSPNTKNLLYVSYNWSESDAKVTQLCEMAEKRNFAVVRDKEEIRVGDSIRNFMSRLIQGERVALFIGPKYLESHYCMWELFHLWKDCKEDPVQFQRRVVPFIDPGLRLGDPIQLIEHHQFWMEKFRKVDEHRLDCAQKGVGMGELQRHWDWMNDFQSKVPDMLSFAQDKLIPRDFNESAANGFEDLWEQFEI